MLNKRDETFMLHVQTSLIQQMFYNNVWTYSQGLRIELVDLQKRDRFLVNFLDADYLNVRVYWSFLPTGKNVFK